MAKRYDDNYGYLDIGDDFGIDRDVGDLIRIELPEERLDEVTPAQITADQNNYALTDAILSRFSTDAARTITGFSGAKAGIKIIANVGSNNLVLANDSASSDAENRILAHSGANITLSAGQLALMTYDFTSARWRAGELT
jgi:hypothetical protein